MSITSVNKTPDPRFMDSRTNSRRSEPLSLDEYRSSLGLGPIRSRNWNELISDVREQKPNSEQELWDAVRPMVRGAARKVLGHHRYLLDDCEQAARSKVLLKLPTFRHLSAFRTWVGTVARNTAYDILRKEGIIARGTRCSVPRAFISFDTEEGATILRSLEAFDDEGRSEARATFTHLMSKVLVALRSFPRAWGEAFIRYCRGLQHSEIGQQLGITQEYSRKLIQRATARLRKVVGITAVPRSKPRTSVSIDYDLDQVIEELACSRGMDPWPIRQMRFDSLSQKVGESLSPDFSMDAYLLSELSCDACGTRYNVRHNTAAIDYRPTCCHYCKSTKVSISTTIDGFTKDSEVFRVGPPKQKQCRLHHPVLTTDNFIAITPDDPDDDAIPMSEPQIVERNGKRYERAYALNGTEVVTQLIDHEKPFGVF